MNDALKNRLAEWRFKAAKRYVKGEPANVVALVGALGDLLGNLEEPLHDCALAVIVTAALESISLADTEIIFGAKKDSPQSDSGHS